MDEVELSQLEFEAQNLDKQEGEHATIEHVQSLDRTAALAQELQLLAGVLLGVFTPALPSLKEIYTEPVMVALCESTARVLVKYNLFEEGIGGRWAEEIALAAVALPLAYATYNGVKKDIAALKAKSAELAQNNGLEPRPSVEGQT